MRFVINLLFQMKERSSSLPRLPLSLSLKRQNSLRYVNPRLHFPKHGDTSFFRQAGRKHFENVKNYSERMYKIMLPEKFPSEKATNLKKEFSYPPPHLIRHSSQREHQGNKNVNRQVEVVQKMPKIDAQNLTLRDKIEDELDKMKKSMEIQRKVTPKIVKEELKQEKPVLQMKTDVSNSPQLSPIYQVSSTIFTKNEPFPRYNSSQLLYNSENKDKYDTSLKGRWLNPTYLSTGLSII